MFSDLERRGKYVTSLAIRYFVFCNISHFERHSLAASMILKMICQRIVHFKIKVSFVNNSKPITSLKRLMESGTVAHGCYRSTREAEWGRLHESEASKHLPHNEIQVSLATLEELDSKERCSFLKEFRPCDFTSQEPSSL